MQIIMLKCILNSTYNCFATYFLKPTANFTFVKPIKAKVCLFKKSLKAKYLKANCENNWKY